MINVPQSISRLKKIISEYHFYLDEIPDTKIRIHIYKLVGENEDNFYFETSHFIKTSTQLSVNLSGRNFMSTEEMAVEQAINLFVDSINAAINQGYEPNKDWLIPNNDF